MSFMKTIFRKIISTKIICKVKSSSNYLLSDNTLQQFQKVLKHNSTLSSYILTSFQKLNMI